ncbi:hypothetical protein P3T76_011953 [Phytophthora citrophthora]|uniref:Uncharacterized protein n=1 Tax=Phytophthora citrophthora TaxID=4793 RepID=A0AAD9G885_9STRA|nr:hypothetical protein P3T76_011953 [Phytophthora citrophthora]
MSEKQSHLNWTYRSGDNVLLRRDVGVQGKMQLLFDGSHEVTAAQEHETLTHDKNRRYLENVHL